MTTATTEAAETPAINPHTVTFTGEIKALATRLGRSVPPEDIASLNTVLQSIGRINEAGAVEVQVGSETLPLGSFVAGELARFPLVAPEADKTVTGSTKDNFVKFTLGGTTSWRRATDGIVRITESLGAKQTAGTTEEIAGWPNPWIKGKENRTRQVVITNTNPALAAKFKAQASA